MELRESACRLFFRRDAETRQGGLGGKKDSFPANRIQGFLGPSAPHRVQFVFALARSCLFSKGRGLRYRLKLGIPCD